jgi:hypothetical protein
VLSFVAASGGLAALPSGSAQPLSAHAPGTPCRVSSDQRAGLTPNLCQSAHSCSIRTGDKFLSRLLPPLLRRLEPDGLLFVTWDEGDFASERGCCRLAAGGNVAAIVAGGAARRGAVSTVPYDHYSVLRTIEDVWRLPDLGGAACPCTRAMRDLIAPEVP